MTPTALLLLGTLGSGAQAATVAEGSTDYFETVKLDIGGYVQPQFVWSPTDDDASSEGEFGFAVQRARFETAGSFDAGGEGFRPSLETKLTVELMPEARLQDAWAAIAFHDAIKLRLGQGKAPTGRNQLTSGSALVFQEAAAITDMSPKRELGAQLEGSFGRHHVDYAVGLFNGEGTNRLSNVNRKFLMAGRIAVSPLGGSNKVQEVLPTDWSLGGKDATEGANAREITFTLAGFGWKNTEGPEGQEEGASAVGADLFFHWRWINVSGEWLTGNVDWEDPNIADFDFGGWYGQLVFFPPAPWVEDHLAVVARVQQFDELDPKVAGAVPLVGPTDEAQEQRHISAGLLLFSGRPWLKGLSDARVGLHYTVKQELEGLGYDNDELMLSSQVKF